MRPASNVPVELFRDCRNTLAAPVGAVGTLISAVDPVGGGDYNASDVDNGGTPGIAITSAATANGSWFYSTEPTARMVFPGLGHADV